MSVLCEAAPGTLCCAFFARSCWIGCCFPNTFIEYRPILENLKNDIMKLGEALKWKNATAAVKKETRKRPQGRSVMTKGFQET